MAFDVQNLRDLLSLARMLRRFAEDHRHDANRELFLTTALALELKAHAIAAMADGDDAVLARDIALHAPVNQLV